MLKIILIFKDRVYNMSGREYRFMVKVLAEKNGLLNMLCIVFFKWFDIKKSHLWLDIFYVSPFKKPFSDLYLSIFEHNLENK